MEEKDKIDITSWTDLSVTVRMRKLINPADSMAAKHNFDARQAFKDYIEAWNTKLPHATFLQVKIVSGNPVMDFSDD